MSVQAPAAAAEQARRGASGPSFIEVQFPVSKLSKESYKERMAGASQTLTGLGKWWGRKPLVLVRAIILGLLLPATDDPAADRETFLALTTMDDDGMLQRSRGALPAQVVFELFTPREREEYFITGGTKPAWRREVDRASRQSLMRRAFLRMSYDQRLEHCKRPEESDGPSPEAWERINTHLGTTASSLPELVAELGARRFGDIPRVGDVFSGGGSIPFEAARVGCDAYGSDLNPVAALLTWGALNIVGGGQDTITRVAAAQRRVFDAVQAQVDAWGIERNEQGWVADAYLYCNEVLDPATGWYVPIASSWIVASKGNVIARLVPIPEERRFAIDIVEGASATDFANAAVEGTWKDGVRCPVDRDGRWLLPSQRSTTTIERLRGSTGLRRWESGDIVPRPDDVFQERLYCIRWVDPVTGQRHFSAPTAHDLGREQEVLRLLLERFELWQDQGYIPRREIEHGSDINRPTLARGWTYWHQLFNPRQLLLTGLFARYSAQEERLESAALLLMIGRVANWSSRLCGWNVSPQKSGFGTGVATFYAPSLPSPFAQYSCRPLRTLKESFFLDLAPASLARSGAVELSAR